MAITLPNIDIVFSQLASSFIERSERGIAVLLIKDDTDTSFTNKIYTNLYDLEADVDLYTATNYQYITDVLTFAVSKTIVIRVAATDTVSDALEIVPTITNTGWITTVGETADYSTIVTWIKAQEALKKTYKAVVYNATTPNCKYVVNFVNTKVTFADTRGEVTGEKYLPSLIGIIASCNVEKGTTYFKCTNLTSVAEVANNDTAVNAGQFILINDINDVPKVGLGVNSLTTFDTTNIEDMRYIDNVETMTLIYDDVKTAFTEFIGAYKNKYDNQVIFISACNTYFKSLMDADILDNNYKNYADVDVNAQRTAWTAIKPEASTWSDTVIKNTAYKRTVFLKGDIKILGAMENLKFNITMA